MIELGKNIGGRDNIDDIFTQLGKSSLPAMFSAAVGITKID